MSRKAKLVLGVVALSALALIGHLVHHLVARAPVIVSNETVAIAALQVYYRAQHEFRTKDRYGIGRFVFANPENGTGMPDLYRIGGPGSEGQLLGLIDETFALSSPRLGQANTKAGFLFFEVTDDTEGPYDYSKEFGLCAVQARYGRSPPSAFLIGPDGRIFRREDASHILDLLYAGRAPRLAWPRDLEAEGWRLISGCARPASSDVR